MSQNGEAQKITITIDATGTTITLTYDEDNDGNAELTLTYDEASGAFQDDGNASDAFVLVWEVAVEATCGTTGRTDYTLTFTVTNGLGEGDLNYATLTFGIEFSIYAEATYQHTPGTTSVALGLTYDAETGVWYYVTAYVCGNCGAYVNVESVPVYVYDETTAYERTGLGEAYGEDGNNTDTAYSYAQQILADTATYSDNKLIVIYVLADGTYCLEGTEGATPLYAGYLFTYEYAYAYTAEDGTEAEKTVSNTVLFILYAYDEAATSATEGAVTADEDNYFVLLVDHDCAAMAEDGDEHDVRDG